MRNRNILVGTLLLSFLTASVWAAPPYVSPNDNIPSIDLKADSSSVVTFAGGVQMRQLELSDPSNQTSAGSGNFNVSSFFDVFVELSLDNGNSWNPYNATAVTTIHVDPVQPSGPVNIYNTEMTVLNTFFGNLPSGYRFRESPTQQSTGTTTIQPLGGGLYQIDSFFDVFVELSVDDGQTWLPGTSNGPGGSLPLNGTPEPATALLLAVGGLLMHRRREAA